MMSSLELWEVYQDPCSLGVGVTQKPAVRRLPAESIRDHDDEAFGWGTGGRLSDVCGQAMEGFHSTSRMAVVQVACRAVFAGESRHCKTKGPRILNPEVEQRCANGVEHGCSSRVEAGFVRIPELK